MVFSVSFPTRHTDTFAATGFVHAGVLLSLTELAYAAFESHCGYSKPGHVVAVQRTTQATYRAPLVWTEGATIEVRTATANAHGFVQEFAVSSTATGKPIALFVHAWVWLDTTSGRTVEIPPDVCASMLVG